MDSYDDLRSKLEHSEQQLQILRKRLIELDEADEQAQDGCSRCSQAILSRDGAWSSVSRLEALLDASERDREALVAAECSGLRERERAAHAALADSQAELRRVAQERDAALAKVAELEALARADAAKDERIASLQDDNESLRRGVATLTSRLVQVTESERDRVDRAHIRRIFSRIVANGEGEGDRGRGGGSLAALADLDAAVELDASTLARLGLARVDENSEGAGAGSGDSGVGDRLVDVSGSPLSHSLPALLARHSLNGPPPASSSTVSLSEAWLSYLNREVAGGQADDDGRERRRTTRSDAATGVVAASVRPLKPHRREEEAITL